MRSLALKLTLAFLLVGVTGAVLVALILRYYTQREFNKYILDQNEEVLLANLIRYYELNQGWAGVEAIFRPEDDTFPLHDRLFLCKRLDHEVDKLMSQRLIATFHDR